MLLLIPLVFFAFYRTYFELYPNFGSNITVFIHIHAFLATCWIVLLIVQPFLIINKKYAWHRKVGQLSYVVFPLFICSFIPQVVRIANSGNLKVLFFPLADTFLMIVFYSLAIYNKRITSRHMRYMLACALVLLGPTVGRIGPIWLKWSDLFTQNVQYIIAYAILIGLIRLDRTRKQEYTPYEVAIVGFGLHQLVYYVLFT